LSSIEPAAVAIELSLVECPSFALTLLHALWSGHEVGINGFASLTSLLMAYFARDSACSAFMSMAEARKSRLVRPAIGNHLSSIRL